MCLQVEIPNLENLNLCSVNIHKIWSDQVSSSFCFQNLIKLVVKDCDKLTYLCSLTVASSLQKLKSLIINECPIMEKIFETKENNADKVCIDVNKYILFLVELILCLRFLTTFYTLWFLFNF